jgi:AcrR family transcriptional regulator
VAEAADVSRRTVYLYFPTQEQLLLDATLGTLAANEVKSALDDGEDPEARVAALARALTAVSPETERAGRALIRLTVSPDGQDPTPPRRGYRRVEWIEQALEPVRRSLDPAAFERLVTALAMITGFEAVVVQRDIRGLDSEQGGEVSAWAARALLRASLSGAEDPAK